MDISLEKQQLKDRLDAVNDESLLRAFRMLLDSSQSQYGSAELDASLEKGMQQSRKGETKPHGQVMQEMRAKYGK